MPEFLLINEPDSIVSELTKFNLVGIDTEFMREKTFFAELCLVQISTGEHIYCVDPLTANSMDACWRQLMESTWVVHSARQDIEVVYQSAGRIPTEIFDTQIAAGLLGYAPQLGYAGLVSELFDVEIAKTHTRADWSRRPLSDAVLEYAAEDVEYLLPAFDILTERLDKQGRLTWAREDSAQLLNPNLYDADPLLAIDRLKGARNLRGDRRAVATHLAAWREKEALRTNRPRQWIVKDNTLIEMAHARPSSTDELNQIEGLTAGLIRRSGESILAAITAALSDEIDYCPPLPPDESQKSLLKSMQKLVAECASELELAAETVASKRELNSIIASGGMQSKVLSGWRREVIGDRLLGLM